jgi:histone deacetylase complex subunit SAP30
MGVKQKPTQSTTMNGLNQVLDKERDREKRRRAAETNVGKEFQTVCFFFFSLLNYLIYGHK